MQNLMTIPDLTLTLRPGTPADAQVCGDICYAAFKSINDQHGFPPDFPAPEMTQGLMSMLLTHPDTYAVVAEVAGRIVGSNFLQEGGPIAGVGPVTVAPDNQNASVGRRLMEAVLERARQQRFAGVRLLQGAFHSRSLSLYTKLGFDVQEPIANLQGPPLNLQIPGYSVRPATEADLPECDRLCQRVHGFTRRNELMPAIQQGSARVVEHDGQITGYATAIGFFGHAVGDTNEDLKALIGSATAFEGSGLLLPSRNSHLFRWCLEQGLRVVQPLTLMSLGLYNQPRGVFLPSILL